MNPSTVAAFLSSGCALVPIPLGEKGPRLKGWQRRENAIFGAEHAEELAGQNAGLAHEHSHTCAIDIDDFDAADAKLIAHGVSLETLFMAEDALSVSSGTPNRGKLLYRLPENVEPLPTIKISDGAGRVVLELRCAGAQDVIAGKHPSGTEYTVTGDPATMPELPASVLAIWRGLANESKPRANGAEDELGKIGAGGRNAALTSVAGSLRRRGLSAEAIRAALLQMNRERCDPPLSHDEVATIAASVGRYEPQRDAAEKFVRAEQREPAAAWPEPLDLAALSLRDPSPPRHIVADWLPAGEVTLLAGHGGAGKSLVSLYVAACIALGRSPWHGLVTEQRPVTVVSAEDHADVMHWRLLRVCSYLGVGLAELAHSLTVIDASAIEAELMVAAMSTGEPIITPAYEQLQARIDPSGVLVLDGASDLYGASEIVRRHVRRYVRALRRMVNVDGAVLLLAHVDKLAARNSAETDRYSGSTAWHNSVRSRWSLVVKGKDNDSMLLTLAKANYAKAGAEVPMHWDPEAHLYLPETGGADRGLVGAIRDRTDQRDVLRSLIASTDAGVYVPSATTGRRTAWHVLSERPEFPANMRDEDGEGKENRRRFWRVIETLRRMQLISEGVIRRTNRHETATLNPTDKGRAECANA